MTRNLWLACLFPLAVFAQDAGERPALTLETIMQDQTWLGEIPSDVKVSPNGHTAYFDVDREVPLPARSRMINLGDGSVADLDDAHRPAAKTARSYLNGNMRIDEIDGDLWIAEGLNKATPLIARGSRVTFVRFLGQSGFIFRENNQLFRYDILTGSTVVLTDLRYDAAEKEDSPSYLAGEERKLLKYVADDYKREAFLKEHEAESRRLGPMEKPKAAYLGKGTAPGMQWFARDNRFMLDISNDQAYVAVVVAPKDDEPDGTKYAEFINREGTLTAKSARARVAHVTETWKAAIVKPTTGEVTWIDFSGLPEIAVDRLAAIKAGLSEEERAFLPKERDKDTPRPVHIASGGFDGHHLLLTVFSRDYKDRWIVTLNARTMEQTVLYHHYDPAWVQYVLRNVDAPHDASGAAAWMPGGGQIYFLSDKDGNQHLYTYDVRKKKQKQLTKGDFQVFNPFQGPEGAWYFHANKTHPGDIHFYRMADDGKMEQLTAGDGHHLVHMSLDGKVMVDLASETDRPPYLKVKRQGGDWKELYDGRSAAFRALSWQKPEVVTFTNRDGVKVYARLYKPASPNGAGVVFTHGAGYLQNAHRGWSSYSREYMFHNLLAAEGYTVLDPDYQGSAGYGRNCRTAIYRHMGGKDLNDVLDGARYLVDKHGVDAARLGTYGGSYGGFLTFMALFTSPDTFRSGAALRPVSDWAHYNHWYTARILNTPEVDPKAYAASSPIYHAEGLKGRLLICHGMVDDNVQYIDTVRLAQRLIELGKKDWEVASFPVEAHGFVTPASWYDEYRRIHELFRQTLH